MSKPVLALDIDDTLFDHFADIVTWYNAHYGTQLTLANNHPRGEDELRDWCVSTVDQAVKRVHAFYDTPEFRNAQPYRDALRVVPSLALRYDIIIVTARDSDILEDFTRTWLEQHLSGHYKEVHFTGQYNLSGKSRTKKAVLSDINARYLLDDSLPNCLEAVESGAEGLLFGNYPWNETEVLPDGITRLRDWQEVERYLGAI